MMGMAFVKNVWSLFLFLRIKQDLRKTLLTGFLDQSIIFRRLSQKLVQ